MAVKINPSVRSEPALDDDEDYFSDTSSILTEIGSQEFPRFFVQRGDRLFPSHGDPPYPLPVDGHEQQRMNDQHDLLKEFMGGNIFAPVKDLLTQRAPQRQIRVLDLCTGTGKWVVEMAHEFPHIKFHALDIAPIATRSPPVNVSFEIEDVTAKIRFSDSSFDFVHARHCGLLPEVEYNAMLAEASRVLRPGGLILLGEWINPPIDFAGRSPPGVTAFCQALNSSLLTEYSIPNIPSHLTDFITQLGGFDDIQSRNCYMPIDFKFRETLKTWAKSAATVISKDGYDEAVVDMLEDGFVSEISNIPGLYVTYSVVTARRI